MKRIADQSLYEILEVANDAAAGEIAAACDRALAIYGPGSLVTYSLMSPEEADLLTRRIEEARATLLDADARGRYDEALRSRPSEPRPAASPLGTPPPVIPALQPPEAPGPARDAGAPRAAEAAARPVILLAAAVEAAGPAEPAGAAVPIPLRQQVPAEPPARTPPPLSPPRAAAPVVPTPAEGAPWTGDVLRQVREARGISVQQIAERTKVTRHHIENIEADRFGALPAAVYLRGILLAVARELRLDGQKVARSYLERAGSKPR